jgi:hypothetical protein
MKISKQRPLLQSATTPSSAPSVLSTSRSPIPISKHNHHHHEFRVARAPASTDRTLEILPAHGGLEAINRRAQLEEIFGAKLEGLVKAILADPEALKVTRKFGVAGVLAIYGTRTAAGLDPQAALGKLEAEKKLPRDQRIYDVALDADPKPRKPYWFQDKPPEPQTEKTQDGIEIHRPLSDNDVTEDESTTLLSIKSSSVPTLAVKFAASSRDYGSDKITRARTSVIDGLKKVLGDLDTIPAGLPAKAKTEARGTHARLKEVLRGFDKTNPLRIFLSTKAADGTGGVRGRTENIFVNTADVGDDKKLLAAILIPLETLLGSRNNATPLTGDEIAGTLLHEMLHALLFRHGVNAATLAAQIKGKIVTGPAPIQHRCELLIAAMLQAQEELFVYDNAGKLGGAYSPTLTRDMLSIWLERAQSFFDTRNAGWASVSKKIDVAEKVAGKRIDWSIDYRHPEKLAVTVDDLVEINEILADHPQL